MPAALRGVPGTRGRIDWHKGSRATARCASTSLERTIPQEDRARRLEADRQERLADRSRGRWTAAPGGPAFYAYSTNYLIDLQAGIIVDVEATPAHRTQEVDSTKTMIDRVEERFDIKPDALVGDTAYGTAPMLGWMVEDKRIAPHVPVWDRSERKDGTLEPSSFVFDAERNQYVCAGKASC